MFVKPKFCSVVCKKGCKKLTHQIAGLKKSCIMKEIYR